MTFHRNTESASAPVGHQKAEFASLSYFVVCIDYGRDVRKVNGLEAIVRPEFTRNDAIARIREALGDGHEIAFVHLIRMNDVPEELTAELVGEAMALRMEAAE